MERLFAYCIATFVAFVLIFYLALTAWAAPPTPEDVAGMLQDPPPVTDQELRTPPAARPPTSLQLVAPAPVAEPVVTADDGLYAATLVLIVWIVKHVLTLARPLAVEVAGWLGHRATAASLATENNMTALSKVVGTMALDYALNKFGLKREQLSDAGQRYQVLNEANNWAALQWPDEWRWVLQGVRVPENMTPQMAQLVYLEGRLGDQLPPIDPKSYTAPAPKPVAAGPAQAAA